VTEDFWKYETKFENLDYWKANNKCSGQGSTYPTAYWDYLDTWCTDYAGECADQTMITWCTYNETHDYPYDDRDNFFMARIIVDFFLAHKK
jgi:hypothetical protein